MMPEVSGSEFDGDVELPEEEQHLLAFQTAQNSGEMLNLAAMLSDDQLDALETNIEVKLVEVEGDDAVALRERLDSLRQLRAEALEGARAAKAEIDALDEDEQLLLLFESARSADDIMALVGRTPDEALNTMEDIANRKLDESDGDEAEAIRQRLHDLRRWRETEQQARATLAPLGDEGGQALANRLVEWVQQPDWDTSQTYLSENIDLLTDEGMAAMTLLHMANPGNNEIELHVKLLAVCSQHDIETAYEQLRQEMATAEAVNENPLFQAVIAFVQAADDEASKVLADNANLLLTTDGRQHIEGFLQATRQQGDETAITRMSKRLAMWQKAWDKTGRRAFAPG